MALGRTGGGIQPPFEETFLAMAAILAEQSSCPSGARHGCIITIDDRVVAAGFGSPSMPCTECWLRKKFAETGIKDFSVCPAVHAEETAVASLMLNGVNAAGGTAWVTREPCEKCRAFLFAAGITRIKWPSAYAAK